jgi:hypothetical protein
MGVIDQVQQCNCATAEQQPSFATKDGGRSVNNQVVSMMLETILETTGFWTDCDTTAGDEIIVHCNDLYVGN